MHQTMNVVQPHYEVISS